MDTPLFGDGSWTGEEELKLLSLIEEQGYGNWNSIGQRMNRSSNECFSHYYHCYISNPVTPLKSVLRDHDVTAIFHAKSHENVSHDQFPESHDNPHDHFPANYPGQEIPHYNPLRGDFDIECFNDAEKMLTISSLALEETGEEQDRNEEDLLKQLVLALVDQYWRTLKQRKKRKKVIREHSLIDVYKILSREKILPPFEQSVRTKMRLFMRFLDAETTEKIIQSLLYEEKLIEKIKQLQKYRSQGIRTFQAAKIYKDLKEKRKVMNERKLKAFEEIHKAACKTLVTTATSKNSVKSKPNPLNITYSPGIDLLDVEEKEVCSVHRILPDVFLRCKNVMLTENKKTGCLRLMDARKLCRIDVNKTRKIYNLLIKKKLIRSPPYKMSK